MRYYPRLKVFKAGRNWFDGHEARSYDWYTYAVVLQNGEVVEVEKSYSNTTSKHMSDFSRLVGYDVKTYRVMAPRGLGNLEAAENAIKAEIAELEAQLLNKRNRNIEGRKARIATLQSQFAIIAMLRADYQARRKVA